MTAQVGRHARDAVYLVGGQVVTSVSALLLTIVVARALGPLGKGYYDIVVNGAMLLVTFTGLSASSGVFYFAATGRLDHRKLLRAALLLAVAVGAGLGGVLATTEGRRIFAWLLPDGMGVGAAALLGVLVAATHAQQIGQAVLKGYGAFRAFAVSDVVGRGGALLIIVVLALAGTRLPAVYVVGFAAAVIVSATFAFLVAMRRPLPASPVVPLASVLRYALPLFVGNAAQFLNYRLDVFFVKNYVGLTGVGVYTVAVGITQLLWLVPNALAAIVMRSVAAGGTPSAVLQQVTLVNRFCLWFTAGSAVFVAALGMAVVPVVFGPGFAASVRPLLWLLPGTVLFSQTVVLSSYLNGIARQMDTTVIACGALVLTIALDLLLIPRHGVAGAAIASTLSYASSCIATAFAVRYRAPELAAATLVRAQPGDAARVRELLRHLRTRITTALSTT
ncbi:MAG TPA: polysaccharide biosynthesis C-terminal domain-containing protein [Gemmatimonadaceae bacterium]|nr:polysaccharide biosynthesis C-terminal domain-containing protein [Gemmatimonadaceae bacterium]